MTDFHYLIPNWPAPSCIKACSTLRPFGASQPPYNSFNLSTMVSDDPKAVSQNRHQLRQELNLAIEPVWIKQVHGTTVIQADQHINAFPEADASWTEAIDVPCAVLTADCLPILLCHPKTLQVAAIHAGWKGLAAGVIEATLESLQGPYEDLLVWFGPAIGSTAFEVGEEVRELFIQVDSEAVAAFESIKDNKWLGDIYWLARKKFLRYGITQIYGGEYCTFSNPQLFYSYRRDGEKTGRMATLIYRLG